MPCLINSQTLKMISQVESFPSPDKQGTHEEGWRIQQPKHCVSIYCNKDEDKSLKNHNQNNQNSWSYKNTKEIESFTLSEIIASV